MKRSKYKFAKKKALDECVDWLKANDITRAILHVRQTSMSTRRQPNREQRPNHNVVLKLSENGIEYYILDSMDGSSTKFSEMPIGKYNPECGITCYSLELGH